MISLLRTIRRYSSASRMARLQPRWTAPTSPAQIPAIKVYNSLTREKNDFVPIDQTGKRVSWYACGPTVYDDSHLGHARNYVSTDIIRRILKDYFKFDVKFVMNITDIDDKIILRGRQHHLFEEFKQKHSALDDGLIAEAKKALDAYVEKNLPLLVDSLSLGPSAYDSEAKKAYSSVLDGKPLTGPGPVGDAEAKVKMHIRTVSAASSALSRAQQPNSKLTIQEFLASTEDVLLPYLDKLHGASIDASDYSIFTKLTKKYEKSFFDDFDALNVLRPDVITRVTEYGDEIVKFVERIVEKGYAYTTPDGSVYFDITAFEKDGHSYARLEPWNRNNSALREDGEGALTSKSTTKRSDADFALWKSSKPGEPAWDSPWGPGRPGWHIECSAMASDVLGGKMDIHSGGIDLAFPHHDNELAQSEAHWAPSKDGADCCPTHQWVNYFFHMGHLSIQGAKMSKSLKNFTTIKSVLSQGEWTPRQLRIVFLLGGWKEGIEITEDLIKAAHGWEERVSSFFVRVLDAERRGCLIEGDWEEAHKLVKQHVAFKEAIDVSFRDSFNTPSVMQSISELIGHVNVSVKDNILPREAYRIAEHVTELVTLLGLNPLGEELREQAKERILAEEEEKERFMRAINPDLDVPILVGWEGVRVPEDAKEAVYVLSDLRDNLRTAIKQDQINIDAIKDLNKRALDSVTLAVGDPYYDALVGFQTQVINTLIESNGGDVKKALLSHCDQLRDETLFNLGIYLEDTDSGRAIVRPTRQSDITARADKEKLASEKEAAKAERRAAEQAKQDQLKEKAKIKPEDLYRTKPESAKYSAWDADGIPTKNADGSDLAKAQSKKLRKEQDRHRALHQRFFGN